MNLGSILKSPFVRMLLVELAQFFLSKAQHSLAKKERKIAKKQKQGRNDW